MTDLLIKQLEDAPEGSMQLDRLIAREIGWHRVEPRHCRGKHGAWIDPEDFTGCDSNGAPMLDGLHGTTLHRNPPAFTTSMDCASTLVPKEHSITLEIDGDGRATANCDLAGLFETGSRLYPTAALAICIAALEAREPIKEKVA